MIRSALLVDFDNVHLCLRDASPEAAEAFARRPSEWLAWLASRGPEPRRILVRSAYLNPSKYAWAREDLLRAGFDVVECPSVTRAGKSSADAHLLLDAADLLAHPTRFDEFILLSSDADFAPLLRRLRAHDRRTTVLCAGSASIAYMALADDVILQNEFLRDALKAPVVESLAQDELLDRIAADLADRIRASGDMSVRDFPVFLRRFEAFTPDSNWLGFRSVRRLVEAVAARVPVLRVVGGDRADWSVTVTAAEARAS